MTELFKKFQTEVIVIDATECRSLQKLKTLDGQMENVYETLWPEFSFNFQTERIVINGTEIYICTYI